MRPNRDLIKRYGFFIEKHKKQQLQNKKQHRNGRDKSSNEMVFS